ncbi:MAG: DUF456 domain-containing protein [Candidatus Omnitrophica bacterium]|nr:DUF456 domain-containing protein [Candidatus Omnitrophota bacterium]
MISIAYAILILSSIAGILATLFAGGGTLMVLAGALIFALMTQFAVVNLSTLIILFALYVAGEVLEYLAVVIGVKKLGASNTAVWGALLGGILGAMVGVWFFGVGIIAGTFAGIFLGAFLLEYVMRRDLKQSMKAGLGGILGRVGSVAVKLVVALGMIAIIFFQILKSV